MDKAAKRQRENGLSAFLKTGGADPFLIGSTVDATAIKSLSAMDSSGNKYIYFDDFEIGLDGDSVFYIQLILNSKYTQNAQLLKRGLDLLRVIRILNELDVSWSFVQQLTFDDQLGLRTEGNVDLLFGLDEANKPVLQKVATFDWPIVYG